MERALIMKNTRKNYLVLILVLVSLIFVACTNKQKNDFTKTDNPDVEQGDKELQNQDEYGIISDDHTVKFLDGRGTEITINKKPERVVVLFPSLIDIWIRNGGELVGMVEGGTGTALDIEGVDIVGGFGSVSMEKVISLNPELVILSANSKSHKKLTESLEENNISVIPVAYEFKDDYFKTAKLFATINDRMDLYEEEAGKIKEEKQEIIDNVPGDNKPKILIMFAASNALTASGSNSTLGEILKDLGTINIADDSNSLLNDKNFSIEKIIAEDPDFIFVQTMGSDKEAIEERIKADAESNPAWSTLSAVKNDRYMVLPNDLYTYKANHRYAEAYMGLAEILYPEAFK